MIADSDGIDAHLDNWIIVAARLGHIAKVEDIFFCDIKLLHEVSHAEDFIHTWSNSINGGGTANFIVEFWSEFFAAFDNSLAFFAVGIPGVFGFGAGFLAEGRKGNLAEAVFDDFVASLKLVFFPIAELFGGCFDSFADFFDLFVG